MSESFFSKSSNNKNGGSISVFCESCIQYRVCSINSKIQHIESMQGCHSYVITKHENYIIQCSISKGSGFDSCNMLHLGDQLIDSTNISHAKCEVGGAYTCSESATPNRVNYTSIVNNTIDQLSVMYHLFDEEAIVYRYNVINNTHNNIDFAYGIVCGYVCHLLQINFSVFSSNFASCLFFNNLSGFVVNQCFLENPNVNLTTSFADVNISTAEMLALDLPYLSTEICFGNFNDETFNDIKMEQYEIYLRAIMHFSMCIITNC